MHTRAPKWLHSHDTAPDVRPARGPRGRPAGGLRESGHKGRAEREGLARMLDDAEKRHLECCSSGALTGSPARG